jgi:uncharacterized protein
MTISSKSQRESTGPVCIGVISDTHGLLRPEALSLLEGSDYILHAGDIGDPRILDRLRAIAPVTAVRGNVDRQAGAEKLPSSEVLEVSGLAIYMLHNIEDLDLNPQSAGFSAVVYGHSHVAKQEGKFGVLYFNPGSAGPRRFQLAITLGKLLVKSGKIQGTILTIEK